MLEMLLTNALTVITVALLFGVTIFIHELGHFLAARKCGLVVDAFAIGFGPALWKRKVNGVEYKICILPFGGYVALPQMDPGSDHPDSDMAKRKLPRVAPWRRIVVALAGVTGNMILAFLIAYIIFYVGKPSAPHERRCVVGFVAEDSAAAANVHPGDTIAAVEGVAVRNWEDLITHLALNTGDEVTLDITRAGAAGPLQVQVPTTYNVIRMRMLDGVAMESICQVGQTLPGSPAEEAGLQRWDRIVAVGGEPIYSREHLSGSLGKHVDQDVTISIQRPLPGRKTSESMDLTVRPRFNETEQRVMIGIGFIQDVVEFDEIVHPSPLGQIRQHATIIFQMLHALVTPKQSKAATGAVGGPVAILTMFWFYVQSSFIMALWFTCLLNVNLAVLNLLPFPVLDGGHIVLSLWEAITRRAVSYKVVSWVWNISAILLLSLFVVLTWRDVRRFIGVRQQVSPPAEAPAATNALPEATP